MVTPTERSPYTRAQLARLIAPRSIAIIGASPRPASFGMRTLENLAHYKGAVYPVNAKYQRIGDLACYPSLKDLPQAPDCALLVVPREGVEAALREAVAVGAGGAIVYASGYGEMAGEDSGAAQRRLAQIGQAAGIPILGPNCMGLVNHELGAGMSFIPEYSAMPRQVGPIAFVSQSGALGYCLAQAAERGVGFRYFFSAGNSSDVDVADLIAAMAEDDGVRAIACLFEGVPELRLVNRTRGRADALAAEFGRAVTVIDWEKRGGALDGAALLANTTTLGMQGHPPLALDLARLPGDAVVNDIVYTPLRTPLLRDAAARGNPTVDGLGMLLYQAQPGFEKWFGVRPEVDDGLRRFILDDLR